MPYIKMANPIKQIQDAYMSVSKNSGTPKWMVYNGQPY